jgi:hypothetical protein
MSAVTNTESTAKGPARKSLGAAMVSISGTRDTVAYHSDRQRMDASGYETIPRSLEGFGDASHTTLKMGEREREVAGAGLSGWFPVTPLPQALWRLGDLLSIARNIEEGLYVARGYAHASHVRNQRQGRVAPSPLPRRPKDKGWSVMLRGEEWLAAPADRKKEGSNQSEARQTSSPVRLFPKRCGRSVGRTRTAGRGCRYRTAVLGDDSGWAALGFARGADLVRLALNSGVPWRTPRPVDNVEWLSWKMQGRLWLVSGGDV